MNPAQSTTPEQHVKDLGPATALNYQLSIIDDYDLIDKDRKNSYTGAWKPTASPKHNYP